MPLRPIHPRATHSLRRFDNLHTSLLRPPQKSCLALRQSPIWPIPRSRTPLPLPPRISKPMLRLAFTLQPHNTAIMNSIPPINANPAILGLATRPFNTTLNSRDEIKVAIE